MGPWYEDCKKIWTIKLSRERENHTSTELNALETIMAAQPVPTLRKYAY